MTDSMIERAVAYFADVDRFDVDAVMGHFHVDCVMEVPTHGIARRGPAEIRETYARRKEMLQASWHGDFQFMTDPVAGRLAVRLTVIRTFHDGRRTTIDNVTILEFTGDKISRVSAWMAGENTLK
jgi:ketosteroid isomerase-like protein